MKTQKQIDFESVSTAKQQSANDDGSRYVLYIPDDKLTKVQLEVKREYSIMLGIHGSSKEEMLAANASWNKRGYERSYNILKSIYLK